MQPIANWFSASRRLSSFFLFGLILFALGINGSVFLLSQSVIWLSVLMLFRYDAEKNAVVWNTGFWMHMHELLKDPALRMMILLFASVLVSGLWSQQRKDWIWFSRMQLPFLLLPVVFYLHGQLTRKHWRIFFIGLTAVSFFVSLAILADYFLHYERYHLLLLKGKTIVTHISHIHFSMLIAMHAVLCLHVLLNPREFPGIAWRRVAGFLFAFFFFFNHLISVKTGLLGMYLGLGIYGVVHFTQVKAPRKAWLLVVALAGMAALAFAALPSLQNKFYYSLWQIGEWQRGKWQDYSDLERLVSWQIGIELIRHDWLLGSGIGDLYQATKESYQECFGIPDGKLPHNQFLFNWAFTGLPGLLALLGLIYHTAMQRRWLRHPLVCGIQMILLFSFLFEYMLETQIGCSLYVYYTLFCWMYIRMQEEKEIEAIP
ncbi:MAG TPA: O-antigen ligase family protein [Saprospiraceae bacterium]|nr:O-antigen ligase family protein [Saprospiraceae bacterium]